MLKSSMTEDSEHIEVIPRKFVIKRQSRTKYRCGTCHGSICTVPSPDRIYPKSQYSDNMIIDIALSKYCDLIPMERYSKMAERQGLPGLAPNSLIASTHKLADFMEPIYSQGLKREILALKCLHMDETTHKMLEGDEKKNWYLWGCSGQKTAYFEFRDTRSGKVASEILKSAAAIFLMSDAYSGYSRAVRETNKFRLENNLATLKAAFCHAHARRKFKDAEACFDEAKFYLEEYKKIYALEKCGKHLTDRIRRKIRKKIAKILHGMKKLARHEKSKFPNSGGIAIAINYFLNNWDGLILVGVEPELPLDNNHQERLLRSPVVGRKTWYGTHSKRGARTAAILFSIVESCKLNNVNPREYFPSMVKIMLAGKQWLTPAEYARSIYDVAA